MPAKSKAQQKFMGMVHGVQKGTIKPSTVSAKVKKAAKGMKKKSATDYASTKHKGLPKKVTVKEISKWLKKLEEFRYRKVRGVDARRVASFVNRGMNEEDLPISLRKKWEHRKYGREKHLANKYMAEYDYDSIQKEGFGGELNDKDKQKFEKARKDNAEVLGYELTGTSDVSETKKRDYKAEYKKFQSSTKAKKYRAELNQYNRKKGTYGNGDGKDASHKGGKIAGFENQSVNRGRAEKSRLRKEAIFEDMNDAQLANGIKHWASKHKGTGVGYAHVLGQLAIHMKEMGWDKSFKEVAAVAKELAKKKKVESVNEGKKRDANNLTNEFSKSFKKFTVAVNGLAKSMYNITGNRTDQKIVMKAFKKHIIPFVQLVDSWNRGQQKNPHLSESVNEGTQAVKAYKEMGNAVTTAIYGIKNFRKILDNAPYNPKLGKVTDELYKFEIELEKKLRLVLPQVKKISTDKMLESVNEAWSTGLERYKVTLENGEDIDVKVKEGKGLEGLEELLEKEGLKFEKITKKASRPTLSSESVNEKMGPEQFHSYMQYVFDTQFKTPEEKKMKKAMIKKINVAQKKKGLPVFKESVNEDIGIDTYLGGIVQSLRKAGLKPKTAKQMKSGFSKSKDKIGFFIDVEQRTFDKKEMYTLQIEIDRDGNLWYLSGHRPMKLGKWADTNKIVRMWKTLNKVRGLGQAAIFKK